MAAATRGRGLSQRLGHSWSTIGDSWLRFASWREEIDQLVGARQLAGEMGRRFAKWWARIRQLATARWSFLLHFCTVADLGDRLLFSIRSWGRGPRSPRGVHFPGGGRPDGLASWRKIDQLAED